jgi:hypothetical protein
MARNIEQRRKTSSLGGTAFWMQNLATSLASPLMSRPLACGIAGGQRRDQRVVEQQPELLGHHAPDAFARQLIGRVIADQRDAARDDGLVDVVDAVGGQEQQAVEILEHAQEHADHGVGIDVVVRLRM